MKKIQKRAFILSECNSPYIQQAIFILKDGFDSENHNVIADAERIVATYMGNTKYFENKKPTSRSTFILAALLSGLLITVGATIYLLM